MTDVFVCDLERNSVFLSELAMAETRCLLLRLGAWPELVAVAIIFVVGYATYRPMYSLVINNTQ